MKLRFLLFSAKRANNINRHFIWIGERLDKIFFNVKYDLAKANIEITPERYLTAAFLSALAYGTIFFFAFYFLLFFRDNLINSENTVFSGIIGFGFFIIFFTLHLVYPRLISRHYATGIDQGLLFALKSMLIQVSSGVSLFNAMVTVSNANYEIISKEFEKVVKDVSAGESEAKALEKLALKTKSEYLKKTSWQILTSLRSGASLEGALSSVVQMLSNQQLRAIRTYAGELNFWILMYLLFAAALPTLGITFMVILSTMGGASVGPEHIFLMVFGAAAMQIILIGFVKTRIPKVYA